MTTSQEKPIYRMSSAGYCPKRLGAIRLDMDRAETPSWLSTAAEEGNWHEERIKKQLRDEGYQVFDEQKEVVLDFPSFTMVGHIDGIVQDKENAVFLLEVKSMSQFEFDRWMRGRFDEFPQYADQATCYMTGLDLNAALYVVKNRSSGYQDRQLITMPSALSDIVQKIEMVELLAQSDQLVDREFDPMRIECKRCEFKSWCLPKVQYTSVEQAELAVAAELWRKGKVLTVQGEEMLKEAERTLKGHARANSNGESDKYRYMIEGLLVSGYPVKESVVSYTKKAGWQCRITDVESKNER